MAKAKLTAAEAYAQRLDVSDGKLHCLVPSGLGDNLWIDSKWWSICEQRDVTFWLPDTEQKRSGPLFQMLGLKYGYLPGLTTTEVWDHPGNPDIPDAGGVLVVHANSHLETGNRLDKWYPQLPSRNPADALKAGKFVSYHSETSGMQYVMVFMCKHGYMEKGGNLLPGIWARILRNIEETVAPVLLIGMGEGDREMLDDVCEIFSPTLRPAFNVPLPELLPHMLRAKAMVGAASGPTILSTYLGTPTINAYPRWLKHMPSTWEQSDHKSVSCFLDELEPTICSGGLANLIEASKPVVEAVPMEVPVGSNG